MQLAADQGPRAMGVPEGRQILWYIRDIIPIYSSSHQCDLPLVMASGSIHPGLVPFFN